MSSLPGPSRTLSPKSAIRRSQKPYSGRPNGQAKLKKKEPSFLDGLKNIVTGPLSWLTTIGKDRADSDEENIPGDDTLTGSKRRGGSGQKARGNSPARKRLRLESSPQPVAGASDAAQAVGGYLDPPMVLRDSVLAPNVSQGANRTGGEPARPSVRNGTTEVISSVNSNLARPNHRRLQIDGSYGLGVAADGRRPHRPSVPVGHARSLLLNEDTVGILSCATSSMELMSTFSQSSKASHSPLAPFPSIRGTNTVVSPGSGIRRTSGLLGSKEGSPEPVRRRQSSVIQLNVGQRRVSGQTQVSDGDQSMFSPLDGVFPRGRSPAVTDVNMRAPMSSPERDRTQGPLRMGSILRQSHTPHETTMRSVSPIKPGAGVYRPGPLVFPSSASASLIRRASSMMNVDQPAANALGRRSSSQVIFDPTMGITSPEELAQANQATAPKPRAPRNNAERILLALEQATPLTEARKLRQKQKEAIRVPASGSSLGGRAGRMLNPYGRPLPNKAQEEPDDEPSVSARQPGALRRYLDAQKAQLEKKGQKALQEQTEKMETVEEDQEPSNQSPNEGKADDKMVEDKAPVTPTKQDKAVEASPEDLRRPAAMPGRATSSLRAGRAPVFRTHVPSSRPTNKFSAKFVDDDDDDGMQEESASLTPAELSKWVERGGGGLEVPTGFSFDFSKPATTQTQSKPQESKSASDDTKKADEKREALIKALRGDKPIGLNPLDSMGPPKLPSIPAAPFFTKPVFAASAFAAPAEAPKPVVTEPTKPPSTLPVQPPVVSKSPSPFTFTATPPAPKPESEIAPKTANGPVSSLPFSFGGFSASKPITNLPFSLSPPRQPAENNDVPKPAPPVFNLATPVSEKPLSNGSTFSFGIPPAATVTSSTPDPKTATEIPNAEASEAKRSTAPSPSPFAVSMNAVSAAPGVPKPTLAASSAPAPIFSFGSGTQSATTTQTIPSLFGSGGIAKETGTNVPTPVAEAKSPFTFTPAPAVTPPVTAPSAPSLTIHTPAPATQAPSFSFTAPTPTTTTAPEPATKTNPFGGIGLGAPPAAGSSTSTPGTQTPSFSFSFGSKQEAPKPSFSFGAPAAAPKPETSSPFSFGGATTTTTTNGFGNGTGFSFGSGLKPAEVPPPPPKTPPATNLDAMDEGSPPQVTPAQTGASSGFSFSSSTVPPSVAASSAPSFGFSFNTPGSNPFAAAPSSTATSNPFASAAPSVSSPANPFAQPTPSSPFPSQPNSPFASPAAQHQVINSPAPSASAFTFGSPQTAPGGFTFSAGGGSVLSPTAPSGTPTTPTFVFGKGLTSPNERPIKGLPTAKRPGAPGTRRATSGRK
ncbi:hypothetical protein FRC04_000014 [Tulasnella sp. 424]|nr:hypothetical protein FRC04_000014 [Tulasnella sp. 424]